jgi:hypothetical protein
LSKIGLAWDVKRIKLEALEALEPVEVEQNA